MNSTVPLDEALPWSCKIARNILVCDTVESDGRFLLYTMASQILKNTTPSVATTTTNQHTANSNTTTTTTTTSGKVLWLECGPTTDRQVATALRKIGCDVAASYLRNTSTGNNTRLLKIKALASEIATAILSSSTFDAEAWLKGLYKEIKTWVKSENSTDNNDKAGMCWVVLNDVSSLGTLLGEKFVFAFVDSLLSFAASSVGDDTDQNNKFGIIIRCSHDLDHVLMQRRSAEEQALQTNDNTGWVGAGGLAYQQQERMNQSNWIPWERCIELKMDAIVDVLPLTSGHSREAHGRLIFSEPPTGRGWGDASATATTTTATTTAMRQNARWNEFLINYCLNDNGVRAIRLRATN